MSIPLSDKVYKPKINYEDVSEVNTERSKLKVKPTSMKKIINESVTNQDEIYKPSEKKIKPP